MTNESTNVLSQESAGSGGLRLRVSEPGRGEPSLYDIATPYVVIGRSSKSDVCLSASGVSYRHAYLQVLAGGVFCVDLGSKSGLFWGKRRQAFGWLADKDVLRVGQHKLTLDPAAKNSQSPDVDNVKTEVPLDAGHCGVDQLPGYTLEVWEGTDQPTRITIDRVVSLIGRWRSCPIHLPDKSVSRVHCSLVLTPEGLWAIDLLGKEGMTVNQQSTRSALLEHGDKLRVGRYVIRVHLRETIDDLRDDVECAVAPPLPPAATIEPAREPLPAAEKNSQAEAIDPHTADWMGTLFCVEHLPTALLVLPNISGGSFRYAQLQAEANALRRKLEQGGHRNLVVDLQGLNYIGSEAIGVVIGLARRVTDRGGKVALCRASENVQGVMHSMGLFRLWPHFETREEAVNSVSEA